jgi:hypothetical protein
MVNPCGFMVKVNPHENLPGTKILNGFYQFGIKVLGGIRQSPENLGMVKLAKPKII